MANIPAKDVMELRKKTGCGMMECKKALVEAEGDFDEAIKILREKGLSVAAKKADRVAAEGVVDILSDGNVTAMVEVNAETDFVAKNETFKEFVKGVLRTIINNKPADLDALNALNYDGKDVTVKDELTNMISVIKENIKIRRFDIFEGTTGTYIHGGGSAGVVTLFDTDLDASTPEFKDYAKNVCMQIAAMGPLYVDKDSVPASVIENEKEILLTQITNDPKLANKPDAIKHKMVDGKIGKYYDTNCLLDQAYVKDEDLTVGQYTDKTAKELGGSIKVVKFVKYERGEGIEKKEENFAEEINKLVNK